MSFRNVAVTGFLTENLHRQLLMVVYLFSKENTISPDQPPSPAAQHPPHPCEWNVHKTQAARATTPLKSFSNHFPCVIQQCCQPVLIFSINPTSLSLFKYFQSPADCLSVHISCGRQRSGNPSIQRRSIHHHDYYLLQAHISTIYLNHLCLHAPIHIQPDQPSPRKHLEILLCSDV